MRQFRLPPPPRGREAEDPISLCLGLPAMTLPICFYRPFALVAALTALSTMTAPAAAAPLSDLLNGGFLVANNARFDNWQLVSLDATGAPNPATSLIQVTPLVDDAANPGVQFTGGGQLAVAGINALEFELRFQVHAIGNSSSFANQALALTGVTFGGDGGIAYVSQETATLAGADLGPAAVIADNESDVSTFNASASIAPHLNLSVALNVFLTGLDAADSINLATFTQRFAQTGPSSLAGDFNNDKLVSGADFLLWQRGLSPIPNSAQDLVAWRNNFGADVSTVAAVTPVPEPPAGVLLIATLTALNARRFRPASWARPRG
jgi:hypothetical protein